MKLEVSGSQRSEHLVAASLGNFIRYTTNLRREQSHRSPCAHSINSVSCSKRFPLFAVKGSNKATPLMAIAAQGVRSMAADVPSAWPGRAVAEEVKTRSGPKPISLIGSTGSIGTQVIYTYMTMMAKFEF